jgi:uncharacterized membrane protein YuzA (DUF378 family)
MCHPTLVLISFVLVVVGALNWGIIAVQPDSKGLVEAVFPRKEAEKDKASMGERAVYALVALAALLLVYVKLTRTGAKGSRSSN